MALALEETVARSAIRRTRHGCLDLREVRPEKSTTAHWERMLRVNLIATVQTVPPLSRMVRPAADVGSICPTSRWWHEGDAHYS